MKFIGYIIIHLIVFLVLGCGKDIETPKQEYVFGLQLNNYTLNLKYINLGNLKISEYKLPITAGVLYRGTFDGLKNYYACVGDTIFEIDITQNNVNRKFNCIDTLIYIFNDNIRNEIIGLSITNDTVSIYQLSLSTGIYYIKKTLLQSNSENFITDVAYNSSNKSLILKIGKKICIVDVDSGKQVSEFDLINVVYGLRYSKNENKLYFTEYSNRELFFKKYDLKGSEQFSLKLKTDIVAFYADNFVITEDDDYIFIAMNSNQNANIIKIEGDTVTQRELISYDAILGFSFVKK